eukprot:COSAG04_NODE_1709_length_5856_cov_9.326212_2_plen_76_part_00
MASSLLLAAIAAGAPSLFAGPRDTMAMAPPGGLNLRAAGAPAKMIPLPDAVQTVYTKGVPHTDRNGKRLMKWDPA